MIEMFSFVDSNTNGYLLLDSTVIQSKGLSTLIGLRFSIRSLNIRLHLQSVSKSPIELRYQARSSSNQTELSRKAILSYRSHHSFFISIQISVL